MTSLEEYKRSVSYIYSYGGGVRDKNTGFAKSELRDGVYKVSVTLKGVYTDVPENWNVYLVMTDNILLHIGNVVIAGGVGKYEDFLNGQDINGTGYAASDVRGIVVSKEKDGFYLLCGMWDDSDVEAARFVYGDRNYKKAAIIEEEHIDWVQEEVDYVEVLPPIPQLEDLFNRGEKVDAFGDDYFYDCVEVSVEQLKDTPLRDEEIINNSFLEHGYYNFKHILFGRVQNNERHTEYFIGVPGMYCNRERFMASMFGFNSFKKSHRSDYANPYFGYWYQEI